MFWNKKNTRRKKARPTVAAFPAPGGLHVAPDETLAALKLCCQAMTPAVLVFPDLDVILQGRFAVATEQTLVLDLLAMEAPAELKPMSVCCVSFFRKGRAFVFVSTVLDQKDEGVIVAPRLSLKVPSQIAGTDVRMAFRVPVRQTEQLEVTVTLEDGRTFQPTPVDISLGGLAVEFKRGGFPELAADTEVRVSLTCGEETFDQLAVVRSRKDLTYGLFFEEFYENDELLPPPKYREVVFAMERLWLRERRLERLTVSQEFRRIEIDISVSEEPE